MAPWSLNQKTINFLFLNLKLGYSFIIDTIFPKYCVTCGSEGEHLCDNCFQKIMEAPYEGAFDSKKIIIAASYKNYYVKETIHFLKYRYIKDLAAPLSDLAIKSLEEKLPNKFLNSKNIIIIPVPLHPRKLKWRGFNQTELIARRIGDHFKIPVVPGLKKLKSTPSQMEIKERSQRLENLRGAFCCPDTHLIKERDVILLDDVTTTGTTLKECENVLKQAGAKEIRKVAVAG